MINYFYIVVNEVGKTGWRKPENKIKYYDSFEECKRDAIESMRMSQKGYRATVYIAFLDEHNREIDTLNTGFYKDA